MGALLARNVSVPFAALAAGNPLSAGLDTLAGAHVLLLTRSQLAAGMALTALDGVAGRIVIARPT